jgi:hypothetical protein
MPEEEQTEFLKDLILLLAFASLILLVLLSVGVMSGLFGDKTIPSIVLGAVWNIIGKL